jgi:hypothetical protein
MSLISNIQSGFTRVATEFKTLRSTLGVNANLTTTVKNTLVDAINEVNAKPTGSGGAPINDGAVSSSSTYSSSKTESRISEVAASTIQEVVGAAPTDLNQIKEVVDFFKAADAENDSIALANQTALGNRLRFDQVQTLTSAQKAQGISNLGVLSATDIGDPATNFVTAFETALA